MKKIIGVIIITTTLVMSCSEDFISLTPVSTVTVDLLYKTDQDFQDAVTGIYALHQTRSADSYIFGDVRADDSWQQVIKENAPSLADGFHINSQDALVSNAWRDYYSIIFRANAVLGKIETADPAVVTNKVRHTAEAKFLRALAYFDLVRIYGSVPLVLKPVSIAESYSTAKASVDEVYAAIIKDLLEAEPGLPVSYSGTNVGRATRGAAKSILGRVYLTKKDFTNAETKLTEVTTMGYALLANYNDLFDYTKNEHHSEYIFDLEFESAIQEGSNFTLNFMPNWPVMQTHFGFTGTGGEFNVPTQGLYDLFVTQGGTMQTFNVVQVAGTPPAPSFPTISLFVGTDKRMDRTVAVPKGFINNSGQYQCCIPITTSQMYSKKYWSTSPTGGNDSKANWKVIRYADVLLMLAEAMNENNKTAQALTYLNQVRTRAGVSNFSGLTKDETREAIYTERRLELSFEGVRWFDLVRTGRAFSTLSSVGMKEHMTLWPIPLSQLQVINNPEILSQNPGYN